jgi:hypothetical protein
MDVNDVERGRNEAMKGRIGELGSPPGEVGMEVFDGVIWHERTRTGDAKHGLQ